MVRSLILGSVPQFSEHMGNHDYVQAGGPTNGPRNWNTVGDFNTKTKQVLFRWVGGLSRFTSEIITSCFGKVEANHELK